MAQFWEICSNSRLLVVRLSLKIRLVLISASAIANDDVTIRDWDETRKEGSYFFVLALTPSFIAARAFSARVLGFCASNLAKKNKRLYFLVFN